MENWKFVDETNNYYEINDLGKYAESYEVAKAVRTQPCSILKVINKDNRTCKEFKWRRDERV